MRVLSLGGKDVPNREATIATNNGVSLILLLFAAGYRGELGAHHAKGDHASLIGWWLCFPPQFRNHALCRDDVCIDICNGGCGEQIAYCCDRILDLARAYVSGGR